MFPLIDTRVNVFKKNSIVLSSTLAWSEGKACKETVSHWVKLAFGILNRSNYY